MFCTGGCLPWDYNYCSFIPHFISSESFSSINHVLWHCFFLSQQHGVICIFHGVNYFSSFFDSPYSSAAFVVTYLLYKLNRISSRLESLSNSSSKLHASFLSLVQSHFNTVIDVQLADSYLLHHWNKFPLWSALIWSSLHGQTPSACPWSKHTIPCLCPKFWYYS